MRTTCRVCGHHFFAQSLLHFKNMPKAAQFLPDAASLGSDKGMDLEICQCSGCGLVQVRSGPVPYYKEVIRAAAVSAEMREFRMRQFSAFVQDFSLKGRKIIEIGCGRGEYLSLMQQCGTDTYGLEYSGQSVTQCRRDGLKVSRGFVENGDTRIKEAPFDAFYILNFLEHLPDPNSVLRGVRNNLTDDAPGLVEVPNFDMIVRNNIFSEFISDHLFYFTKDTLTATLSLNGFDVVDCKEVWHDYIISATVKKKKRMDLAKLLHCGEKITKELEAYLLRFQGKKVAVWGAGHQALAVLSQTGMADRVKYVIDSADFKQGKYTPATHIPIVSPDTLNADPVDAVIVMAASYSDEVAGIIREKYDSRIHVAILREQALEDQQNYLTAVSCKNE